MDPGTHKIEFSMPKNVGIGPLGKRPANGIYKTTVEVAKGQTSVRMTNIVFLYAHAKCNNKNVPRKKRPRNFSLSHILTPLLTVIFSLRTSSVCTFLSSSSLIPSGVVVVMFWFLFVTRFFLSFFLLSSSFILNPNL